MARFQTAVTFVVGAVFVVAGCGGVYLSLGALQLQNRYHSAPRCASEADALAGKPCRYTGTAKMGAGSSTVSFTLDGAPGRTFVASFGGDVSGMSFEPPVQAELWAGRVTVLGGAMTTDNPDDIPPAGGLIASTFLIAIVGTLIVWIAYRGRRDTDYGPVGQGEMNPIGTSGVIYRP